MVASGNSVEQSTYGLSSRTWLAGLIAQNINDRYYQPIDKSYGWCATDGTAPFDNVYYLTGYNNNHGRYEANKHGYSTMGLQINGSRLPYITSDHAQYYKSSKTGGAVWDHAPINYNPGTQFTFAPKDTMYDNGFKYVGVAQGSIAPVLKFDFSTIFYTPIISYYLLKSGYTIADWDNVADPLSYDALVESTVTRDVKSFYDYVAVDETLIDRIVIYNVRLIAQHINWKSDGTYSDITTGSDTNSTGVIAPLAMSDATATLNFDDWYTTDNPDNYTVNIDMSCVDNYTRQPGTIRGYNERTQISTTYTYNTICARTISGIPIQSGRGYNQPSTYPYTITPVCYDDGKYTIKRWESDTSLTQAQRHYVTVYTTIAAFGTLDNFIEYCRKCAAYTGGYFSDCIEPAWTHDLNQPTCYLGTIDMAGITHGQYTSGTANDDQPQKTWGDNWSKLTPYEPGKPPKPERDPNKYILGMPGADKLSIASFTQWYAMTPNDLSYLRAYLAYIPTQYTDWDAYRDYLGKNYLNSNPIDNMVSLKWFPFDVVSYVMQFVPVTHTVKISNAAAEWTTSGTTYRVVGTTSLYPTYYFTLYLGSFTPQTAYGNFLDYEPYSDAKMYLPFCGTAAVDLKAILDVTLYVSYKVDVRTGSCTAQVTADSYDGNVVLTAHGTLAVDMPITGVQSADYQNGVYQAINNLKNAQITQFTSYIQSATGLISSVASVALNPTSAPQAVSGAASGIAQAMQADNTVKQAQYELATAQIRHTIIGSTSAGDGAMMYLYPALIVNRPQFIYGYNDQAYAHTVGHACILSDMLGSFQGYTIVSDIDLSGVEATETEKNMLRSQLASGVYL